MTSEVPTECWYSIEAILTSLGSGTAFSAKATINTKTRARFNSVKMDVL